MAWRRDNLRVAVRLAPTIEESGPEVSPDGEGVQFLTPQDSVRKAESMPSESLLHALSSAEVAASGAAETYFNAMETLPKQKTSRKEVGIRKRNGRRRSSSFDDDSSNGNQAGGGEQVTNMYGGERKDTRGQRKFLDSGTTSLPGTDENNATEDMDFEESLDGKLFYNVKSGGKTGLGRSSDVVPDYIETTSKKQSGIESEGLMKTDSTEVRDLLAYLGKVGLQQPKPDGGAGSDLIGNLRPAPIAESGSGEVDSTQNPSSGVQARNRWRRLKHAFAFTHHMSENVRSASSESVRGEEERKAENPNVGDDVTRKLDGAVLESAKESSDGQFREKGRKGMEGMLVKQDRGIMCLVQDFYVACLKMPIGQFFVGVFIAPIALGLFFTPIYLLDVGGLSVEGANIAEENTSVGRFATARQNFSALMHVFIYALSLSTTFGGSPVAALSPYCLCVANVHTLMGQFLFVFLSGAVFARMSQPSHPIRCSKTAIIKTDDFNSVPAESKDQFKLFAVRLVLAGPPPCELVDAKICLTFRIFIKLPSGSMFCSTRDLKLVRPEVSYLRYGIMVRHVIDKKSPLYEHTMESLMDGDASFSLTVMGLERASMQPIFHLEDYYVCDGDVAWDADYVDFIHVNKDGHRVLDHSRLDLLKVSDNTKMAGCWKRKTPKGKKERQRSPASDDPSSLQGFAVSTPKAASVLTSKSQSFTRASHS